MESAGKMSSNTLAVRLRFRLRPGACTSAPSHYTRLAACDEYFDRLVSDIPPTFHSFPAECALPLPRACTIGNTLHTCGRLLSCSRREKVKIVLNRL